MADTKTVSAKFETDLLEELERYKEEQDMNRSEAIRTLMRTGLDVESNEEEERESTRTLVYQP